MHIIDQVLMVPGSLNTVATNANLTALLGAIRIAGLTDTLVGSSDLTIFAPSNSAFQDIASALPSNSSAMDVIANLLTYHVVNGTVAYSADLANQTLTTLGGSNVTITVVDGGIYVNGAQVVNPDVLYAGGVVHVIDSVLNPNNMTMPPGASNSSSSTGSSSDDGEPDVAFDGTSSSAVPFTSGIPTPTTTVTDLVTTIDTLTYTPTMTAEPASDSSEGIAGALARPTGAMGAAALFGGAAFWAGM